MTTKKAHLAIAICDETFQHDAIKSLLHHLNATYCVTLIQEGCDQGREKGLDQRMLESIDLFLFLPLTGSKLSKLANGYADTSDLAIAIDLLRRHRPVVIALITQNASELNENNLMKLMVTKNIYFVPFYQDDPIKQPNRLIASFKRVPDTLRYALKGKQLQPLIMARDRDD